MWFFYLYILKNAHGTKWSTILIWFALTIQPYSYIMLFAGFVRNFWSPTYHIQTVSMETTHVTHIMFSLFCKAWMMVCKNRCLTLGAIHFIGNKKEITLKMWIRIDNLLNLWVLTLVAMATSHMTYN